MDSVFHFSSRNPSSPLCRLSDYTLGSMRNVWKDGENKIRSSYLSSCYPGKKVIDIELIHSKEIVTVRSEKEADQLIEKQVKADGIITNNKNLIPVITVADCMPIFVYAEKEGKVLAFGVLHSGWKGSGICCKAVEILESQFQAEKKGIYFLLGPHIRDCCYRVDSERAEYFSKNFTPDCLKKNSDSSFQLSLEKANLALLEKIGIDRKNIMLTKECTCCAKDEQGNPLFGSFRREHLLEGKEKFRAMAASISFNME
ncbi:MAG: polyphenol oxidase family protein [Treponemataceae bacterium]|nr:polyphenol oxidase family protein [Treponemataceae bacterium]